MFLVNSLYSYSDGRTVTSLGVYWLPYEGKKGFPAPPFMPYGPPCLLHRGCRFKYQDSQIFTQNYFLVNFLEKLG